MGRELCEAQLAIRDLEAISAYLGVKKYFMGDTATGIDATIFAFVSGAFCVNFDGAIRTAAEGLANLRAYSERMMGEFYPELTSPKKPSTDHRHGVNGSGTLGI